MPRSPKSDNSGEDVDDSLDSDDDMKSTKMADSQPAGNSPASSPKRGSLATQSLPTIAVTRSESVQSGASLRRVGTTPSVNDARAHKAQSLEVLTEMLSIDGDSDLISGFDPARWIVASGVLEKRRDGRMREGWAKRWFVLGKHTLYYYLLPKTDASGYTPLLGDERGQIKLSDIQDVQAHARDKEYWYLTVTFALMKKNTASQYFSNQVSNLQLRTPADTGQLWMEAIIRARDAVRSGASPSRPLNSGVRKSLQGGLDSSLLGPLLPTPTALAGHNNSESDSQASPRAADMSSSRISPLRRVSSSRDVPQKKRAIDLVSIDEAFPFAPKVLLTPFFLLVLAVTIVGPLPHYLSAVAEPVDMYLPLWLKVIPLWVFWVVDFLVVALFATLKRRQIMHDSLAREARFRIEYLRKEMAANAVEREAGIGGAITSASAVGAPTAVLPLTSSELIRAADAVEDERHQAGTSMTKKNKAQAQDELMTWTDTVGSSFKLRVGPNYKKNGFKGPSGDALYTLIGMDLVRSKDRICNLATNPKVDLPSHRPQVDPSMDDIRKAGVPRLFIVNTQIPDKAPPMMGKNPDDSGYSLVFYFSVKQSTVDMLSNPSTVTPAGRLLKQYVKEHRSNPDIRRRFKAIGVIDNFKDLGIAGVGPLIDKFNGKPAIINKVAEIYESGPDCDWFEVDISIFDFPYMARRGLYGLKDRLSEIALRAGFVLQGEADEELPECLLGGGEMSGLDFRLAKVI